jgi:hypothetical protein
MKKTQKNFFFSLQWISFHLFPTEHPPQIKKTVRTCRFGSAKWFFGWCSIFAQEDAEASFTNTCC